MQFYDPIPTELADAIARGLSEFNTGIEIDRQSFAIAEYSAGRLAGGITASMSFSVLFVNTLWVAPAERGKRLGSRLLRLAEEEGVRRQATTACADTLSLQAPEFYLSQGYHEFGRVGGRSGNRTIERIWFRKPLQA